MILLILVRQRQLDKSFPPGSGTAPGAACTRDVAEAAARQAASYGQYRRWQIVGRRPSAELGWVVGVAVGGLARAGPGWPAWPRSRAREGA